MTCNIMHRDLKLSNIALHFTDLTTKERFSNNESLNNFIRTFNFESHVVVKIIDYGLARVMLEGDVASTSCGTLIYSAPEVLLG